MAQDFGGGVRQNKTQSQYKSAPNQSRGNASGDKSNYVPTQQDETYGWVDQSGNAMRSDGLDPVFDIGSLIGNFWGQGYDSLGRSIENNNLRLENSPEDYWGLNAELGYEFNPNPESVKKNQQKIDQNNAVIQEQKNAASNMFGDFVSGKFDRTKDYSSKAAQIAKEAPEEYAENVANETEGGTVNQSDGTMDGKGTYRSSGEIWQDWYSGKENPEAYANFNDFQFAGNNANDWLDFMLYADREAPGMYSDILREALGDSYGFDVNDAEALAAAQAAYGNWYNPWVSTHSVDDILNGTAAGAEIIGGYAADQAGIRDYLNSIGGYIFGDDIDTSFIGFDENGVPYDMRTNTAISQPYLTLGDGSADTYLDAMLANLVAQNMYTTEDQYDLMAAMFDKDIDYGTFDDSVYTMAGADPYQEQLAAQFAAANMMDPTMYLTNPEYAAMVQQVYGNRSGLGSNQLYTEDQWKALLGS